MAEHITKNCGDPQSRHCTAETPGGVRESLREGRGSRDEGSITRGGGGRNYSGIFFQLLSFYVSEFSL